MPFVRISMFPRPKEVKEALAKELTQVISKHCKISDDHTWIVRRRQTSRLAIKQSCNQAIQ